MIDKRNWYGLCDDYEAYSGCPVRHYTYYQAGGSGPETYLPLIQTQEDFDLLCAAWGSGPLGSVNWDRYFILAMGVCGERRGITVHRLFVQDHNLHFDYEGDRPYPGHPFTWRMMLVGRGKDLAKRKNGSLGGVDTENWPILYVNGAKLCQPNTKSP